MNNDLNAIMTYTLAFLHANLRAALVLCIGPCLAAPLGACTRIDAATWWLFYSFGGVNEQSLSLALETKGWTMHPSHASRVRTHALS